MENKNSILSIEKNIMKSINKTKTGKYPRGVTFAKKWKEKEISNVIITKNEMESYKIDQKLIKEFLDQEYDRINKTYIAKLQKCLEKQSNTEDINIKQKKEKAIEFLLKNKYFLEQNGASKEYIESYVNTQYEEINNTYVYQKNLPDFKKEDIPLDNVDFID